MIRIDWKQYFLDNPDWIKDWVWFGWYWKEDNGEHFIDPYWERFRGPINRTPMIHRTKVTSLRSRWKFWQ